MPAFPAKCVYRTRPSHPLAARPVVKLDIALCIVILFGIAGCTSNEPAAGPDRPFQGLDLHVATPAGWGFPAAWELALNDWGAQTGATCRLHEIAIDASQPAFGMSQAFDQNALVVFPLANLAEIASGGALAAIPGPVLADDQLAWRDIFQGLRESACSWQGAAAIAPLHCPVLVCYYRADLLKQAGLPPPYTWRDYQVLLERLDVWAPGLTAVEPWSAEFRTTMFLARAVSYARHPGHFSCLFDIETGAPLIGHAGFTQALEDARLALGKMSPAVLDYNPDDCRREFFSGRAALAVAYENGPVWQPAPFAAAKQAKPSAAEPLRPANLVAGFCRLPGVDKVFNPSRQAWEVPADGGPHQVTLAGFGGLAIGVSAHGPPAQIAAAWNAVIKTCAPEWSAALPPGTASLCRESQLAQAGAWCGGELQGHERSQFAQAVAASLRDSELVSELPVPRRAEFRQALSDALTDVLAGKLEAAAGLAQAATRWQALIEAVGVEKFRDVYRQSLGLRPKPAREQPRASPTH